MKKDSECSLGDDCVFAHSVFEIWLHPARYRTQLCSYGMDCKRGICFFAHHPGELRVHENTADLIALEKELDGTDNSSAGTSGQFGSGSSNMGNRFGGGSAAKSSQQRSGQKNALGGGSQRGSPLPVSQSLPLHADALLQAVQWSNLMNQSSSQQQQALMNATMIAEQAQQAQLQAAVLAMSQSINNNLIRSSPQIQAPSPTTTATAHNILSPSPKAALRSSASPLASAHAQEAKNNDVKQALELVSQLKDLVGRAQGIEVCSVLLALLPDVLSQAQLQVASNQPAQSHQQPLNMSPSSPIPFHSASNQSMNPGAWSNHGLMSHGSPSLMSHIEAPRFSPIHQPPLHQPPIHQPSFMQQDEMGSSDGFKQPYGSLPSQGLVSGQGQTASQFTLTPHQHQHQHQHRSSPADVLSLKSKRSEQTTSSSRSQSPTQSENVSEEVPSKKPTFLPMNSVELESPFCTPLLHPDLHRAAAEQEKAQVRPSTRDPVAAAKKKNNDESLAAAMSEMSGASAMIASLSLLVDPFDSLPS